MKRVINFIKNILPKKNTHYLYQSPINKELFSSTIMYHTSATLIFILFAFIVISAFTTIKEASQANGEIEPQENTVQIKHFDGGIVKIIYVNEGDKVKKGDILASLGDIGTHEDLKRYKTKLVHLQIRAERLKSILQNRAPNFKKIVRNSEVVNSQLTIHRDMKSASDSEKDILKKQISQAQYALQSLNSKQNDYKRELTVATKILTMRKSLSAQGYESKVRLLEEEKRVLQLERELNSISYDISKTEESILELKSKLSSYDKVRIDNLNKQHEAIIANIDDTKEQIKKLAKKDDRRHIRSPVSGIIKSKMINAIGESVYPNKAIFEIVPFDTPLVATVNIDPDDIGHIKIGDTVRIKVSAYDFIKYGTIEGQLAHISAGTFTEDDLIFYRGKVKLNKNYFDIGHKKHYLMPGMLIKAEIVTGDRTILEYLLKPFYRSMSSGLTER